MDPKIFFVAAKHGAYPAGRLTFEGFIFRLITCTALHFHEASMRLVIVLWFSSNQSWFLLRWKPTAF